MRFIATKHEVIVATHYSDQCININVINLEKKFQFTHTLVETRNVKILKLYTLLNREPMHHRGGR